MRSYTSAFVLLAGCLGLVNAFPTKLTGCDVCDVTIPFPTGQTTLVAPTDAKLIHIAAGFGTQNYSCSAAGTYASIGAVAELFDASCVYKAISGLKSKSAASARSALGASPLVLGHHYFVPNPAPGGTGVSPKFDFTSDSEKGNKDAFVVTAKAAGIPSPSNTAQNVDWLELTAVPGQGKLAKYVYRIDTIGGQPPTSCAVGSAPITVPYTALYWFYK